MKMKMKCMDGWVNEYARDSGKWKVGRSLLHVDGINQAEHIRNALKSSGRNIWRKTRLGVVSLNSGVAIRKYQFADSQQTLIDWSQCVYYFFVHHTAPACTSNIRPECRILLYRLRSFQHTKRKPSSESFSCQQHLIARVCGTSKDPRCCFRLGCNRTWAKLPGHSCVAFAQQIHHSNLQSRWRDSGRLTLKKKLVESIQAVTANQYTWLQF